MTTRSNEAPLAPRTALRKRLLDQRDSFVAGPQAASASAALTGHLIDLLHALEPELLGSYWPRRSEFNAASLHVADTMHAKLSLALPFAQRSPPRMHYRAWDGKPPALRDECDIASSTGAPVLPDVVLVPCIGYTSTGFRLGYGGGYFDRWLAEHPDVTAIGVAWSVNEIDAAAFDAQPHDLPLALIVTERGIASSE